MSSNQARGRSSPPVRKSVVVQYLKDGHSSPFRPPLYSPYPPTGHSSVGRVVCPYETPPLLLCLRRVRAFTLSTSRACNEVHVGNGSHRTDIRLTSGDPTLHYLALVHTQERLATILTSYLPCRKARAAARHGR